ncbi:hypothetical protein ACFO1B_55860 [Dactylosporangium siamense]|uniref:hypothetical protein n=1 Tax=Dactylosporangium siamense TaxID=685454 RepID=UPI001941CD56|nr:hypothetical protein [Dactylosporangium siamense]
MRGLWRAAGLALRTASAGMLLTATSLAGTAATGRCPLLLAGRALGGLGGALVFIAGAILSARLAAAAGSMKPITVYSSGTGLGDCPVRWWCPARDTSGQDSARTAVRALRRGISNRLANAVHEPSVNSMVRRHGWRRHQPTLADRTVGSGVSHSGRRRCAAGP